MVVYESFVGEANFHNFLDFLQFLQSIFQLKTSQLQAKKTVSLLSGSPDLQRRQLLCSLTVPPFHDLQHSLHQVHSVQCSVGLVLFLGCACV